MPGSDALSGTRIQSGMARRMDRIAFEVREHVVFITTAGREPADLT